MFYLALKMSQSEMEAMKKQSDGLTKEYDRLLKEHQVTPDQLTYSIYSSLHITAHLALFKAVSTWILYITTLLKCRPNTSTLSLVLLLYIYLYHFTDILYI